MKRTAFRLQPVLELRRVQERTAGVAAAAAARTAAAGEEHARAVAATLGRARPPSGVDGAGFLAAMLGLQTLATDADDARASATATAEQAEAVRAAWTAAAQRTAALERLAERHRLAALRAELAAEERAVDDIVTGRHSRREEESWRD